jgi:predicted nucleotidyltransferase
MPELREQYDVTYLGVFGSYAQGRQRKTSDLDLLVEFGHAPGLFRFVELQEYLSKALGVHVDLVMRRALKPEIGRRIIAEVVPV